MYYCISKFKNHKKHNQTNLRSMNKTILVSLLLTALLFSVSCKKDKTDKTEEIKPSISVDYDGTTWSTQNFAATYSAEMNTTLIIASNGAQMLSLAVEGINPGIYPLNEELNFCSFDNYSTFLSENPDGEIVITNYDSVKHEISGTFHFVGETTERATKAFTNGKFNDLQVIMQP